MKYCVIGQSLPHTLSPEIHRAFGREDYGVREFSDEAALAEFVKSRECDGYNVTIPYKRAVMPMLDEISEGAREIGAVNTVVQKGGKLVGYNTDVDGMRYALKRAGIDVSDKNALILGSGGTCKTAEYVLKTAGAKSVKIVSRSGELNYDNCYEEKDTQIIINTTPVGMMPHSYEMPIDLSRFEKLEGVFDCIYNPLETMLINKARALGVKADNGLAMLVEQGRIAHNLFQEAKGLPTLGEEATERVIDSLSADRRNIVLIGMAGSGKSVIGKNLAAKLERQFVDTDAEIEKIAGKSIPDIFKEDGEGQFRELERQVVERVSTGLGLVISTGGGAVLNERNVFFMRANGRCYMIARDVDMLATKGRPLSPDRESAKRLYEERKPIYFATADTVIDNDGDIESAVSKIIADFYKEDVI